MSTIRADSVAPSAGGTSRNLPRGVAAAWANLNGTGTIAVRDSQNVSSFTDNGTGDYTKNLTTAMSNANYGFLVTAGRGSASGNIALSWAPGGAANPTASVLRIRTGDSAFSALDAEYSESTILGSLA